MKRSKKATSPMQEVIEGAQMKRAEKPRSIVERVNKIPCPNHGFLLDLVEQDGKLIAICNCDVKPNKHLGEIVVERAIDKE